RKSALATGFRTRLQGPETAPLQAAQAWFPARRNDENDCNVSDLSADALVAHAREFHRAVGDGDAEGGTDGAFNEMDVAAMGADQLGGDGQAQPAAAGAAGALERLEQMLAGFRRQAGAGVGDLEDRDRAFAATGDADLHRGGVVLRLALQR